MEMSAFVPRKLSGRRVSGAGGCDGCDGCNGVDHDDDARAGPIQGHSGRGGWQAQAVACSGTAGTDDPADSPAGRPTSGTWRGGFGIGTPSEARQPSAGPRSRRSCTVDHP